MSAAVAVGSAAAAVAAVPPDPGWDPSVAEWLAGIFMGPPSADVITSYREGFGAGYLGELATEAGCQAGVQRMQQAIMTDASPASVAGKLALAFTHLFNGVDGHRTVPLYESAYVSEFGRLFQAPTSEIGRLLDQWDTSTQDWFMEPPDHLAVELALLAHLMRRGDLTAAARDAEAALLHHHLLVWVPLFAARCEAVDETGFYAGAASVLNGFLSARRAALQRTCPPTHPGMGDNSSRDHLASQERK